MKDIKLKTKRVFFVFLVLLLPRVVKSQSSTKPNILLICIDDLRPELKSFGADYISSPNIDVLAKSGVSFHNHFVNAPSCGPSRYTLLTGGYGPSSNAGLLMRAKKIAGGDKSITPSMPEWFKTRGYTTVSVGKVSHYPGGMGGKNWNNPNVLEMPNAWDKHLIPVGEWQHPQGIMHGLANGEIRKRDKSTAVFQSEAGNDQIYPDGIITDEALNQLNLLSSDTKKPFFLAVGIIKPHLPFGAPKKYYDTYEGVEIPSIEHPNKPDGKTTWHNSSEFRQYNSWGKDPNQDADFSEEVRRHYAACVSYADAQVGKILSELKRTGADKNTIVVLWGDHGWHLGEHAIWGKHSLFEESLRSPLIIHYPGMKNANSKTKAFIETIDIFPTLCELTGVEAPHFAQGQSLINIIENPSVEEGHPVAAYFNKVKTIRTKQYRMTLHNDGFVELYDHSTPEKETKNIAIQNPETVNMLKQVLEKKFK